MFNSCVEQNTESHSKIDKLRRVHLDYFQQPGINKLYSNVVWNYLSLLSIKASRQSVHKHIII